MPHDKWRDRFAESFGCGGFAFEAFGFGDGLEAGGFATAIAGALLPEARGFPAGDGLGQVCPLLCVA